MDVYEALVQAYNEEAGCSSTDGEIDYLGLPTLRTLSSDTPAAQATPLRSSNSWRPPWCGPHAAWRAKGQREWR